MEKSFGLLFYLKKRTGRSESELPVYIRITINGICKELSIKRKCNPKIWNTDAGRIFKKFDQAKVFNGYLDTIQQKVFEGKRTLLELDKPLTAENIKMFLQGNEIGREKHMIMEIFRKHNDQMAALVGLEYSKGTLERYETSYRHTLAFLQWKYKSQDMEITKLNYEFITEYEFWLKSARKCGHNSTMKYLNNFKKIVNRCIRNGWLHRDPFLGFKMTKREVDRTALTELELQAVASRKFHVSRLSFVRDIFIFSCFTGLAYADVKKLRQSNIIFGVDGKQWVSTKRQKTDSPCRIPLLAPALEVLDRYKIPEFENVDLPILPILSNQKMNAYLKEIADLCGVKKNLTYHLARHTFATTVTLSNGIPIETVSKMLGHRNLTTTQQYAKILDKKISNDMESITKKYLIFG